MVGTYEPTYRSFWGVTTLRGSSPAFLAEKKHQVFFWKKHRTRKNSSVR